MDPVRWTPRRLGSHCRHGATFLGVAAALKERSPSIACIAVEPAGSQPIARRAVTIAQHVLQGTGYGTIPPAWQASLCDGTMAVTDADAQAMRERLARLEGLHVGFSAAANVSAASCLLRSGRLPADAVVAIVLCDSGMKY